MPRRTRLAWGLTWVALGLLVAAGCQKAGRFGPRATKPGRGDKSDQGDAGGPSAKKDSSKDKAPPLPTSLAWMIPKAPDLERTEPAVPIKFIHEGTDPAEWNKLDGFWTRVRRKPATPLGRARYEIRIKVPLGLDDPTPYIPPSNPPTVGKWELGKRLFFDDSYLHPKD